MNTLPQSRCSQTLDPWEQQAWVPRVKLHSSNTHLISYVAASGAMAALFFCSRLVRLSNTFIPPGPAAYHRLQHLHASMGERTHHKSSIPVLQYVYELFKFKGQNSAIVLAQQIFTQPHLHSVGGAE